MTDETIVAVFDTADHAQAARTALLSAGVPADAIELHAGPAMTTATGTGTLAGTTGAVAPVREQGFWSSLFGGSDYDDDATVYDRSVASGSTVLTVKAPDEHVTRVMEILESHHPIDIDERAAGYGLTTGTRPALATPALATPALANPVMAPAVAPDMPRTAPVTAPATAPLTAVGSSLEEETLQLSAESLAVGKRLVNRGGTRIRRYVVETPVEESVTLHDEKVVLERRPVADGRTVGTDGFTERTIEMIESAEEAVVTKTARVVEEIGLRKEATDRVETVRDTVRKEEVEVVKVPGTETTTRVGPVTTTGAAGGTTQVPRR